MPGIGEYQHFLGVVVDSNDPTFKGRCKVNVFGLFDDLSPSDLPWSFPIHDNSFGSGGGGGRISVPKNGAVVHVRFNNGNYYMPEYHGLQELSPDLINELSSSYAGAHSLIYDTVEDVKIFYTQDKGLIIETKGSTINITKDSKVIVTAKSDLNLITPGGSIKINEAGQITATGSTVTPNAQGGWNCLPTDPYTGMVHIGDTLNP